MLSSSREKLSGRGLRGFWPKMLSSLGWGAVTGKARPGEIEFSEGKTCHAPEGIKDTDLLSDNFQSAL